MSECAPLRLNKYISRTSFEVILIPLSYTDREDVKYNDGFFHMRQMKEVCIDDKFNLSCIYVLDKIMTKWFNAYAPVFMCVGGKPTPFGNERHTICCGLTSIFWRANIAEGKYFPKFVFKKNTLSWEKN